MNGIDYFLNSVTFRKAAIPAQPLFTFTSAIIGAPMIYLGAMVTGVIERCRVLVPIVHIARNTLEILEGVLRQGLTLCRIPKDVIQTNLHRRLRILGVGDLRPGRDENGQGSNQQCAGPDHGDDRQFGSHSHCLYPLSYRRAFLQSA